MNLHIKNTIDLISNKIDQYEGFFSTKELSVWYNRQKNTKNVFSYFELMIEEKETLGKHGISRAYHSTFNSLRKFCGTENLLFADIDHHFLRNYEFFLLIMGVTANTIAYYMRNLRTIYNRAADDHVFVCNEYSSPFRKIKTAPQKTIKRALSVEQIKDIASLELKGHKNLEFARDMFMASFYLRGMPFVDLINLNRENIIGNVVFYRKKKTSSPLVIEIVPPLKELIDKYNNGCYFLFPFFPLVGDTTNIPYSQYKNQLSYHNKYLKKIGKLFGINIPLTSYVARHSWATCAKNKGASTAVISEGLGHSSEKIYDLRAIPSLYLLDKDKRVILKDASVEAIEYFLAQNAK